MSTHTFPLPTRALLCALIAGALSVGTPIVAAPAAANAVAADAATAVPVTAEPTGTAITASSLETADLPSTEVELAQLIAEQWKTDPLFASPQARQMYPASTLEEIRSRMEAIDGDVYLALVPEYDEHHQSSTQLLSVVSAFHGDAARVRMVSTTAGGLAGSVDPADPDAHLLERQFLQYVFDDAHSITDIEWILDVLERLADPQVGTTELSLIDRVFGFVVYHPVRSILIGLIGAAALGAAIWVLAGRQARNPRKYRIPEAVLSSAAEATRSRLLQRVHSDSSRVAAALREQETRDLAPSQVRRVQHGLDSYDWARKISADTGCEEDDLAGALVLLDMAEKDLQAVAGTDGTPTSRTTRGSRAKKGLEVAMGDTGLCAIDPRHGSAVTRINLSAEAVTGASRSVRLTACTRCRADHAKGVQPQWLRVDGEPYVGRDTVWARTLFGATEDDLLAALVADSAT
ncbi:hypothetical protein [Brevibacterium sp.]|uniref:hypothetical protein n=1 Tax=Brevibacterium sp. TaxID=1701 RepID=UPI0028117C7E|nr:hypothetical protein [Brevibacterium sp.]